MLALHVCGDAFTDEEKARDFAYYEALTVRDSSLSACTQAVIAAEVGHLELAYDYFARGRADGPRTTSSTTRATACTSPRSPAPGSPPSPASAACATTAASSASRRGCPARLERLAFRLVFRGRRLQVEATKTHATYLLLDGEPLELEHHGKTITLSTDGPVTEPIPPAPSGPHRPSRAGAPRRGAARGDE